ncbi:MAG: DUF4202 domain-containing protein [Candidatus Omnitrophota bacterium]|nr:DUF4202 domain-containing protein [Candidatus Omnitrophota bacterium]
MDPDLLQRVLARIDQLNGQDPNTELVSGIARPRELVYAQRLTDWVLRLDPDASETLRIAACGQHVQRWTIPRERYERNRRGYLRWREVLKTFHAQTVTGLMEEAGYPAAMVEQVRRVILKKALTDPDTQTIEDALCLVFLETQFADLRRKTPEEKMREVLQKTWKKMTERAREEALRLPLAPDDRAFLLRSCQP